MIKNYPYFDKFNIFCLEDFIFRTNNKDMFLLENIVDYEFIKKFENDSNIINDRTETKYTKIANNNSIIKYYAILKIFERASNELDEKEYKIFSSLIGTIYRDNYSRTVNELLVYLKLIKHLRCFENDNKVKNFIIRLISESIDKDKNNNVDNTLIYNEFMLFLYELYNFYYKDLNKIKLYFNDLVVLKDEMFPLECFKEIRYSLHHDLDILHELLNSIHKNILDKDNLPFLQRFLNRRIYELNHTKEECRKKYVYDSDMILDIYFLSLNDFNYSYFWMITKDESNNMNKDIFSRLVDSSVHSKILDSSESISNTISMLKSYIPKKN